MSGPRLPAEIPFSWEERLAQGATEMGIALGSEACATLRRHASLLQKWGRRFNLTARLDPQSLLLHHLDSLALLAAFAPAPGCSLLDIGSGAGFPGISLRAARPDLRVTLLEPSLNKSLFLEEAARDAGLQGLEVMRRRLEDLPPGRKWDLLVSRAVSSLERMLAGAVPATAADGSLALYKGPAEPLPAASAIPAPWRFVGRRIVPVPGKTSARAVLLFRRQSGDPSFG